MKWDGIGAVGTVVSVMIVLFLEWPRLKMRAKESAAIAENIFIGFGCGLLFFGVVLGIIGLWNINVLMEYDGRYLPLGLFLVGIGSVPVSIVEFSREDRSSFLLLPFCFVFVAAGLIGLQLIDSGRGEVFLRFFDFFKDFR